MGNSTDGLTFAYECCKANGGAAGVDGQTFEDIAASILFCARTCFQPHLDQMERFPLCDTYVPHKILVN
jgi:hypothetical protein